MNEVIEVDLKDILAEIKANLKDANWSKNQTKKYLIFGYCKDSPLKLDDDELLEFLAFTRQLKHLSLFKFSSLTMKKLPTSKYLNDSKKTDVPLF